MNHGRPKATGRFDTRAELVRRVGHFYMFNDISIAAIARNCGISAPTADAIIETREWLHPEDVEEVHNESIGPLGPAIPTLQDGSCGFEGWDFPRYPVHIHHQFLNELERME